MPSGPQPQGDIQLGGLLARLSEHMDHLNARLEAIEQVLAAQSNTLEQLDKNPLIKLQGLDHVRQALADLTLITARLGADHKIGLVPVPPVDGLLSELMLSTSRDLLWHPQPGQHPTDSLANGDVDLF